jgi:recombination protein RecT
MTKELIAKFSTTLAQYESKVLTELLAQHGLRPAQFTQIVLTEVKKNPKMLEAFQKNPSSLFASILHCAELGLSPSEMAGEFYFIPYNGIIKPILGYKGLTALMLRNQGVQLIYAETVHRADTFEYELGLDPKLVHKPLDNVRNSSTLTHVYAVAKLSNGEKVFKVMSVQEIMGIMATMKQNNTLYFDDKKDPMMWMPRKTVIKQLAKLLPKDYFGTHAVGIDDRVEGGGYLVLDDDGKVVLSQETASKPVKSNVYSTLGNLQTNDVDLHLADEQTPVINEQSSENDNNISDTTTVRIVKKRGRRKAL